MEKTVVIVGGGFSGMLTAVNLSSVSPASLTIKIVNKGNPFGRGIAFNPYSKLHLLNVMAGKMSAFPDEPDNFVEWLLTQEAFKDIDKDLLSVTYLPRKYFGLYLDHVWQNCLRKKNPNLNVEVIDDLVSDIEEIENGFNVQLEEGKSIHADYVVLATGNSLPRTPSSIKSSSVFNDCNYFGDPWSPASVKSLRNEKDILIIGNGLTMVDTVLGLLENGFHRTIYSISPNGFWILPHRHNGVKYPHLVRELEKISTLTSLVSLFNKHIKKVRSLGLSAEPVVDSIRSHTQILWQRFTVSEKRKFMSRLRHLWGVARHRLPIHLHDRIQHLKADGKLIVHSGELTSVEKLGNDVKVTYFNRKTNVTNSLIVERVINCTGPESDITRVSNKLMKNLVTRGIVIPDELRLGIQIDPDTFQIVSAKAGVSKSLFAMGNLGKGILWESTAVPELRVQSKKIADKITSMF